MLFGTDDFALRPRCSPATSATPRRWRSSWSTAAATSSPTSARAGRRARPRVLSELLRLGSRQAYRCRRQERIRASSRSRSRSIWRIVALRSRSAPRRLEQHLALDPDQLAAQVAVVGEPLLAGGRLGVLAAEHRLAHPEAGAVEVAQALQLRARRRAPRPRSRRSGRAPPAPPPSAPPPLRRSSAAAPPGCSARIMKGSERPWPTRVIEDQGEGEEDDLGAAGDARAAPPAPRPGRRRRASRSSRPRSARPRVSPASQRIAKTKARRSGDRGGGDRRDRQSSSPTPEELASSVSTIAGSCSAEQHEEGDLEAEDEDAPEGDGAEPGVGVERARRLVAAVEAGDDGGEDAGDVRAPRRRCRRRRRSAR